MKEKKHYETPRFSVTQVITEGVFAASGVQPGTLIEKKDLSIEAHSHAFGDSSSFEIGGSWNEE